MDVNYCEYFTIYTNIELCCIPETSIILSIIPEFKNKQTNKQTS